MNVYDGIVPDSVPTAAGGVIRPYVAVWTQPLREHPEQSLDFDSPHSAGELTVTVAGATVGTVRNLSQAVAQALNRVTAPGGGEYVHAEPHVPIQYDTSVTPKRYYQPLRFLFAQP